MEVEERKCMNMLTDRVAANSQLVASIFSVSQGTRSSKVKGK